MDITTEKEIIEELEYLKYYVRDNKYLGSFGNLRNKINKIIRMIKSPMKIKLNGTLSKPKKQ